MENETNRCDLCHQNDFEIIAQRDRHGQPLQTKICKHCGLIAHLHIPTEDELQEYYAKTYRLDYHGEVTPSTRRVMRAWLNGQRILRQVAPHLPGGCKLLEVGAGIGCTVNTFERAGYQAEGIDPGDEFLAFSRNQLNARVQVGDLYDLPESPGYDAILLVHVIEHFASPRKAIEKIGKLLKRGGMLYVECPNLEAPFASRSRLFHVAHIHNFVPATLEMLACSCGFTLQQRFGDDQDPNLQMLFQYSGEPRLQIAEQSYRKTRDLLRRSDWMPYHFRSRYMTDRVQKLLGYAREHLQSKRFVQKLISECRDESDRVHESQKAAA
jgi:SAM-dependent methyltransferase